MKLAALILTTMVLFILPTSGCSFAIEASNGIQSQTEGQFDEADLPTLEPSRNTLEGTSPPADNLCEPNLQLVTDLDVHQPPPIEEPEARVWFKDPVFGTCMIRVTSRFSDLPPDDPSSGLKNEYSRVQSFNADGSLLLVRSIEANWYLYDAQTFLPLGRVPLVVEPRWDANDPDLIYHLDETRLLAYRISTDQQQIVHDFSTDFAGKKLAAVWTRYEGSPSLDTHFWGLMAEDEDWSPVAVLVYDREKDTVFAQRELPPGLEIDSVTISPLGNYLLVYHDEICKRSQLGDEMHPCGLMVYELNLQHGRGLLRSIGHSDLTLDVHGREVLVYLDIDTDHIAMLDLSSGEVTPLWPIEFTYSPLGLHFSGRAFRTPGWVLVSTYSGAQPAATWMDDQVFAMELKPGGRVFRLAHTHSIVDEDQQHDYWAEPHASVNPDFSRVIFTTNWGRPGTGEVELLLIELPKNWLDRLP